MQLFLDTANIEDIKKYAPLGLIDGITTNPSLIAKEGVSLEKRINEITAVIDGPISTEVIAAEFEEMMQEAKKYASWHKNIVIKVPCTANGLKTAKALSEQDIKTNVTLIFSSAQALLAAKAGATYVSPFIGRLDDISQEGMDLIEEIIAIFENYYFETQVLVASIRHPRHVIQAARLGADVCTIPADVVEKLINHPLTDIGLEKFLKDWEKVKDK